jgi:hypothetical protein
VHLVSQKAIPELGVVVVGVEEGVGQVGLFELTGRDRKCQPAVVVLADEFEHPTRHRDGDAVIGQLSDERVHHFGGRFPWER